MADLPLHKISETSSKITLGWTPVASAIGYRFQSAALAPKWSHTWDPSRDTVTFAKGQEPYTVQALGVEAEGIYPSAPPTPGMGAALPAKFPIPSGPIREVSTESGLVSALSSVNPGETISLSGNLTGQFRVTRSGTASAPILIRSKTGQRASIIGPNTSPSQPLRIEPGVHHVALHDFDIRNAYGPSSQGLYLKDCADIELVGLDIHSDRHTVVGTPGVTSGVMGIFSSANSARCVAWNLHLWENGSNYAADHAWYMEGDDHWLINSLVTDHDWGYGLHLYPTGNRRRIVNCTVVGTKKSGMIVYAYGGGSATDDLIINSIAVDSPDYAYRVEASTGCRIISCLAWDPTTIKQGTAVLAGIIKEDPLLDASYHPQVGSPVKGKADPAYCPPLDLDGNSRSTADLGCYAA